KTDAVQKTFQDLAKKAPGAPTPEAATKALEEKLGIPLDNLERTTGVILDLNDKMEPNAFAVLHTSAAYDQKKVLAALAGPNPAEEKHKDQTLYRLRDDKKAVICFPNDRVILMGPAEVVKRGLDAAPRKGEEGPLGPALKAVAKGDRHLVAGGIVPP